MLTFHWPKLVMGPASLPGHREVRDPGRWVCAAAFSPPVVPPGLGGVWEGWSAPSESPPLSYALLLDVTQRRRKGARVPRVRVQGVSTSAPVSEEWGTPARRFSLCPR